MQYQKFWKQFSFFLSWQDKKSILYLLIFSIIISVVELLGISMIMPYIAIVQNPDLVEKNYYLQFFYNQNIFATPQNFIFWLGILLIVFYLLKATLNIIYYYAIHAFGFDKCCDISKDMLQHYLNMPYVTFTQKNTSTLEKNVLFYTNQFSLVILHCLYFLSELGVLTLIYAFLLYYNWQVTLVLSFVFSIKIYIVLRLISTQVAKQGSEFHNQYKLVYKNVSNTFKNFKYIKILATTTPFITYFDQLNKGVYRAKKINEGLLTAPKNILESFGFCIIIAVILYSYLQNINVAEILPVLSVFILALYRILPALNRLVFSYNQILFCFPALNILFEELSTQFQREEDEEIQFNHKIELRNICFSFELGKTVLENISLSIPRKNKVAFIGESGGGKTTLVDIIAGIHKPNQGNIYIDDKILSNKNIKSWRRKIGYITQFVQLIDGTVGENVALGYEYNEEKVIQSLKKANIYDFFASREGTSTKVGDNGAQLSGGQCQRVAIARALYNDPEILILDEATSALDSKTEEKIIQEIYEISKEKTLIVIAHRLNTLSKCDNVFKLKNGNIEEVNI